MDSRRIATYSFADKVCTCTGDYYQQPNAGTCVDPCPSVPTKHYGNNATRYCITQCPNDTFGYDDVYQCWADCPVNNNAGQKLFRDYTNWLCVSNCPTT